MSNLSVSLEGLERGQERLQKVASRIARLPQANTGTDTVDLSAEMVALLEAKNSFAANAKAIQTADEMQKSLFSLLG